MTKQETCVFTAIVAALALLVGATFCAVYALGYTDGQLAAQDGTRPVDTPDSHFASQSSASPRGIFVYGESEVAE